MGGHWEPISFLVQILYFLDLNWLVSGSAPSKKSRSAPEVFLAGHNRDMTDTGNRARKTSGTQGRKSHDFLIVDLVPLRHINADLRSANEVLARIHEKDKWYEHAPGSVNENDKAKLFRGVNIQCHHVIKARRTL